MRLFMIGIVSGLSIIELGADLFNHVRLNARANLYTSAAANFAVAEFPWRVSTTETTIRDRIISYNETVKDFREFSFITELTSHSINVDTDKCELTVIVAVSSPSIFLHRLALVPQTITASYTRRIAHPNTSSADYLARANPMTKRGCFTIATQRA